MTALEAIKSRRSVRQFKDQTIPDAAIDALVEAMRWAPSNEFDIAEVLHLPRDLRPIALIPVGYPAKVPEAAGRISKEELIEWVR